MTIEQAIERYVAIPEDRKARFLVSLSWWLTVSLRGCYGGADPTSSALKLQGANEIQHRLTSEACCHLAGRLERYCDDVLIRSCAEAADYYKIGGEFIRAFERALDRFEPSQSE